MSNPSPSVRFWLSVLKTSGCWKWTGLLDHGGYGRFYIEGKHIGAHRYRELWGRQLRSDEHVDHVCRVRRCVNPAHLRVVTARQNALENNGSPPARNASKTLCHKGHPLDAVWSDGGGKTARACRTCERQRAANKRAKRQPQENETA